MPIRFRCRYCNQLMGIARRKAGTEVECPTCKGKLLVPQTSAEPSSGSANGPQLFEGNDFDDVLNPQDQPKPILAGAKQAAAAPQPNPFHFQGSYDVEPLPGGMAAPLDPNVAGGIFLSPGRATLLAVAVILGFALAFSLGILVGSRL